MQSRSSRCNFVIIFCARRCDLVLVKMKHFDDRFVVVWWFLIVAFIVESDGRLSDHFYPSDTKHLGSSSSNFHKRCQQDNQVMKIHNSAWFVAIVSWIVASAHPGSGETSNFSRIVSYSSYRHISIKSGSKERLLGGRMETPVIAQWPRRTTALFASSGSRNTAPNKAVRNIIVLGNRTLLLTISHDVISRV